MFQTLGSELTETEMNKIMILYHVFKSETVN